MICTVNGRCLPVLLESMKQYALHWKPLVCAPPGIYYSGLRFCNEAKNFGDAYNAGLDAAFALTDEDGVVMLNDDCVLTPDTAGLLWQDVVNLHVAKERIGIVGSRADWIRLPQSVRYPSYEGDTFGKPDLLKWESESKVFEVPVVAPVCAYVSREAFKACRIPPLNWYSDDVWCFDLVAAGFKNFVSRAYVHHVGAQHTGLDAEKLTEASKPWIKENRPVYYERWFK